SSCSGEVSDRARFRNHSFNLSTISKRTRTKTTTTIAQIQPCLSENWCMRDCGFTRLAAKITDQLLHGPWNERIINSHQNRDKSVPTKLRGQAPSFPQLLNRRPQSRQ